MESYKIKVLGGDEINDLISDLLELALKLSLNVYLAEDVRFLIRLAQLLHESEPIDNEEKERKV